MKRPKKGIHNKGKPLDLRPATEHEMRKIKKRFYARCQVPHDPTKCWEWTGSKQRVAKSVEGLMVKQDRNSYGLFSIHPRFRGNSKTAVVSAHRASYAIFNGPVPAGQCVCHHCDNPSCVNPAHLFLGSLSDNIQDAIKKGRFPYPLGAGRKPIESRKCKYIRYVLFCERRAITIGKLVKALGLSESFIRKMKYNETHLEEEAMPQIPKNNVTIRAVKSILLSTQSEDWHVMMDNLERLERAFDQKMEVPV